MSSNEEAMAVAQRIYDYAIQEISNYLSDSDVSMSEQYSTFMLISNEVSSYLMGNAVSVLSPNDQNEEIATLGRNIKKVAGYIQKSDGSKMN